MNVCTVFVAGTAYLEWYKWKVLVKVRSTCGLLWNVDAKAMFRWRTPSAPGMTLPLN